MTDEELIERASRGDELAFRSIYERHCDAVFRFAYRMCGDFAAAEDVTQECFLGLVRNPARFDSSRAGLRTYLFAAARNQTLKLYRRSQREERETEDGQFLQLPDRSTPLGHLLEEELADVVQQAVAALPPLQRETLILADDEELSLQEIAQIVDAEAGAVKVRLHRARENLRKLLVPYLKSGEAMKAGK